MKIQPFKRLSKTDFPDAPDWMEPIFQVLNNYLERNTLLAQGNMTFGDNIKSEKVKLKLKEDTSTTIHLNQLKQTPEGVIVLNADLFDYPKVTMEPGEEPLTVNVKVTWSTTPTDEVETTLLFIGS